MVNRTYRYFTGKALYPFGYGLSFTNFIYRKLHVRPTSVSYGEEILVDVYVENSGPFDGEEVVQLYVAWGNDTVPHPVLQLVGFNRYFIPKGFGVSAQFTVKLEQLAVWDDNKSTFTTLKGQYTMFAGGQQPKQIVRVGSNTLQEKFNVI